MIANKSRKYITKSEIIKEISKKHKTTKAIAETALNTVLRSIKDALKNDDRVEIRGFGTFELRHYKAYQGRNPQTGETIQVRAKKLPFFKIGRLKNIINKINK